MLFSNVIPHDTQSKARSVDKEDDSVHDPDYRPDNEDSKTSSTEPFEKQDNHAQQPSFDVICELTTEQGSRAENEPVTKRARTNIQKHTRNMHKYMMKSPCKRKKNNCGGGNISQDRRSTTPCPVLGDELRY